jgi:hypothetical protein
MLAHIVDIGANLRKGNRRSDIPLGRRIRRRESATLGKKFSGRDVRAVFRQDGVRRVPSV